MLNKILKCQTKAGFTFFEVMIASSMALAIWGTVVFLFLTCQQSYTAGVAFLDVQGDARVAVDWMVRDIRGATRILASRTIGGKPYVTSNNELVLEVPAIDASGDIINIDTTYDYIVFHISGGDSAILERVVDANSASSRSDGSRIVAHNVNSLNFTQITDNIIGINLNTRKISSGGRALDKTMETVVKLRNR